MNRVAHPRKTKIINQPTTPSKLISVLEYQTPPAIMHSVNAAAELKSAVWRTLSIVGTSLHSLSDTCPR